jgi:hypothetical protein
MAPVGAIRIGPTPPNPEVAPSRYRVAGLEVRCAWPIAALQAFAKETAEDAADSMPAAFADEAVSLGSRGLLAGEQRLVEAAYRAGRCALSVQGIGTFELSPRGIMPPGEEDRPLSPARVEALLGPALLLVLAASGRYALHAGAALVADAGLWLFLGDSGCGKSTLAAHARAHPGSLPVADDILPVRLRAGMLQALPWYPQLKLGPAGQYAGGVVAEGLPVSAVCSLEPRSAAAPVTLERLPSLETVGLLTWQTVSARLYGPRMRTAHFCDIARVARSVPAYRLGVPRDLGRLGEVYAALSQVPIDQSTVGVLT